MRRVLSGLDQIDAAAPLLKGKRVGLMTNQTGINSRFESVIDILSARFRLTALFAVEHGIRGSAQAGEHYETRPDPKTGVPVYAVYGKTRRLTDEMLDTFDVFVFDMQDVGARFYTYLYALSFAIEECARAKKPVVVLDRVNPLGGERIEGTVLDTAFASYVGMYPLPTRYGMTIGEYALWAKNHLKLNALDLRVVPLSGWRRADQLDDLDIAWPAPSPNCATFHAALCYPGTCIFEGTSLSEGRGTTMPFEYVGAPWIDAPALEERMRRRALPGLYFRPVYFTPTFSKFAGQPCAGVQMHITDRKTACVTEGALTLLDEIRSLHPGKVEFLTNDGEHFFFDLLLGTDAYRRGLYDGPALLSAHAGARERFLAQRRPFLLYD